MVDPYIERLLNDFIFADCRLGSQSELTAALMWREEDYLLLEATTPSSFDVGHGLRISIEASLPGYSLSTQSPVLISDGSKDARYFDRFGGPGCSELAVPLFDSERALGVLNFESSRVDFFAERHVRFAQLLGALLVYARWHARDGRASSASAAAGEALRQARDGLGLTQAQLAERLGIGRTTLSRRESGAQPPSRADLRRWCEALGLAAAKVSTRVTVIEVTPAIHRLLSDDPACLARLTPDEFEQFVANRLDRMGYDVALTRGIHSKDGGIDLIAVPRARSLGSFLLAGQVKHHRTGHRTGRAAVDRLLAWKDSPFRMGLLVTNTEFTRDARWLAGLERNKSFLRLRDFTDLQRWIRNDFSSALEVREIPEHIAIAPGVSIPVPRATLQRPSSVWPEAANPTRLRVDIDDVSRRPGD